LVFFEMKSCSSAAATDKFWGIEFSVPAPYQDGEVPPGAISIDAVASTTISIDFTAISTNVVVSYDEEGVVLTRG
jgi:hypothetical protein